MHRNTFLAIQRTPRSPPEKNNQRIKTVKPPPLPYLALTLQGSHSVVAQTCLNLVMLFVFDLIHFNRAKEPLRDILTYSRQLLLTQRKSGFSYCQQTCTQLQGPTFFCFAYKHQQQILFLTIISFTLGCISCIRDDCPGLKNS